MSLTLSPDVEQKIISQAQMRGISVDEFTTDLLKREIEDAPQPLSVSELSADELRAGLWKLSETATAVTNYPDDFFSREVIYADHD